MPKVAFMSCFAVVVVFVAVVSPQHSKAHVSLNCFRVFINAIRTDNAKGTFDCLALGPDNEQETLFAGNGWNSDADIQRWVDKFHKNGTYLQVKEYVHNPTQLCKPNAQQAALVCHVAYLVFLIPWLAIDPETINYSTNSNPELPMYVEDTQAETGLEFMLDGAGRIAAIQ